MVYPERKYGYYLIFGLLILFSVVGMVVVKGYLEVKKSSLLELYFRLFQVLFVCSLALIFLDWFYRRWREYKLLKNEKLKEELLNLKNQIRPHFYFNTLNNLHRLIKKDADKAQEYVLKLSDLMRYAIYSAEENKVRLEEEINYLENFIALQEIRHRKGVQVKISKTKVNHEQRIAPLLLIVLVENAFKHGVETLIDGAYITITMETEDNGWFTFDIENNYKSLTFKDKKGVGLENLRKRLQLLYPTNHKIKCRDKAPRFSVKLEIKL